MLVRVFCNLVNLDKWIFNNLMVVFIWVLILVCNDIRFIVMLDMDVVIE